MSTSPQIRSTSVRAFILAIGLLLASIFAAGTATAGPLVPAFDVGAPGGGGGVAATTAQADDFAGHAVPGIRAF